MTRVQPLVLALSLISLCLAAQGSPFHGGQWAMQFGGNSNLFSLGVLHFTSARSAWLLDLSNSALVLDATNTDKLSSTTTSADQQAILLSARLGKRFYQTGHPKVVSFQTLALEGGWSDQMIDITAGNIRQTTWNAGLNFELGAAYMLTSNISVGGTAGLSAGYLSFKNNDPASRETGHGYYDRIRVMVALGLYF
ncbi:MAG TPA: hypothetical protein VGQ29_14205 [Gemmatimonadales bacterium]|nr:hypothetical protein [Gemmatimonadales bacterium]